jgi:hypothetical protein
VAPESDSSDDYDDVRPGAGAAQHGEDLDFRGLVDPSDAASSASDPSDPKVKRAREEGPALEEEPSDTRARLVDPARVTAILLRTDSSAICKYCGTFPFPSCIGVL